MTATKTIDWTTVPVIMTARNISEITGLSKPVVYDLLRRADFPAVRVGERRIIVSRDAFRQWMGENLPAEEVKQGEEHQQGEEHGAKITPITEAAT